MAQQLVPAKPPDPWIRWPAESYQAYRAFTSYLRVFPGRSVVRAYRLRNWPQVGHDDAAHQPSGRWKTWSRSHRWMERADAFDRAMASAGWDHDDLWEMRRVRAEAIERLMPSAQPPPEPVQIHLSSQAEAELTAWLGSSDADGNYPAMPALLSAQTSAPPAAPVARDPRLELGETSAGGVLKQARAAEAAEFRELIREGRELMREGRELGFLGRRARTR